MDWASFSSLTRRPLSRLASHYLLGLLPPMLPPSLLRRWPCSLVAKCGAASPHSRVGKAAARPRRWAAMRALVPWKPWEDEVDAVVHDSSAMGAHEQEEGGVISCVPELATASPACRPRPGRLDASTSHPEAPGHAIPPVSLPSPFPTMADAPVAAPSS